MKKIILVLLACVSLVPAGDTFQSGTVAVTAIEDTAANITYNNIRDALVLPLGSSTYKYRIKSLGASTKLLKTGASVDVVPGTTMVVASSPGANQTTSLLYTPSDDEFTLFPTSSTRSTPAVVVAVVEVLDAIGAPVSTVDLRIDIQGVTDTREGESGYYQSPSIIQPAAITIPRGGSVQMNYVEFAALCGFVDKERDGFVGFQSFFGGGFGGSDGWSITTDNNPASATLGNYSDEVFIKGTNVGFSSNFAYGDSSDYSTDSITITMPANHPLGTFDLSRFYFAYDPDGGGPLLGSSSTGYLTLQITVTTNTGGGGSGSGGGSGGGGCGLGTMSGLLMLAMLALGMRLRLNG